MRGTRIVFWSIQVATLAALLLGSARPALAHEGEENVPASTSVQEAIAIIRSQPELTDDIADKVGDALESEDQSGVDVDLVRQAQDALDANDLPRAELLLEQAIGACPGATVSSPGSIRSPQPITTPCPKPAHLSTLASAPIGGAAEPVLLTIAALMMAGGVLLARRIR